MPTDDRQIFNGPELAPDAKKKQYVCWKTGTRPEDGVKFTAFSSYVARKSFAQTFDLSIDEVMARLVEEKK